MHRVRFLLMDLFRQVLSGHGREAPALTSIIIERASEGFDPRLVAEFSNGHRTSVPVRAHDFYAFCERHATWDLDSLRCALLAEGHEIYARMVDDLEDAHSDRRLSPISRREADTPDMDAPHRLREWWNRRWHAPRRLFPFHNSNADAEARGVRLLTENLSPAQRDQYDRCGYFEVKRYRVWKWIQMNVEELNRKGQPVRLLCFMPEGRLVIGDVMLAQKFALELFETETLSIANTFAHRLIHLSPAV
jgi:hypothetical protein